MLMIFRTNDNYLLTQGNRTKIRQPNAKKKINTEMWNQIVKWMNKKNERRKTETAEEFPKE